MLLNLNDFEKTVVETVASLKKMDEGRKYSIERITTPECEMLKVIRTSEYPNKEAVITEHTPNTFGIDEMMYFMEKYIFKNPYTVWLSGSKGYGETLDSTLIDEYLVMPLQEESIDFNLQRLNKFFEIIKWQKEN